MDASNANSSAFKTPSRRLCPGTRSVQRCRSSYSRTTTPDRFIPSRAVNNFEVSQHILSSGSTKRRGEDSPVAALSPAKEESEKLYKESLSATFGVDISNKVLDFGVKRFQSTDSLLFESLTSAHSSKKTPSSLKRKLFRTVPQTADRVLDAPGIVDDFYISTLDWGHGNSLAVALGNTLYIWKSDSGSITELYQTPFPDDYITSVQWDPNGNYLAVGTSDCEVQIWNVDKAKMVRSSQSHVSRVSSLSWNGSMLSSGSRSGEIHHHDVRAREMHVTTLRGHNQEVCGLKWSPNGRYLASGSNDCIVNIWDSFSADPWSKPKHTFTEHRAAVKSLAWCPWETGLLATGGGTADKNVHFWNVTSGQCINTINTTSQISGLLWNEEHREILVAHGYPSNQMVLYQYPSLRRVAELRGHDGRILHIAGNPDKTTVASVGADETLRLWKCFMPSKDSSTPHSAKKRTLNSALMSSPFAMFR